MEAVLPCISILQFFMPGFLIVTLCEVWPVILVAAIPHYLTKMQTTPLQARGEAGHTKPTDVYFKQLFKTDQKGSLPKSMHTTQR